MKHLYLIRGIPGSGKSTFAATLAGSLRCPHHENDSYLYMGGEYVWSPERAYRAYKDCLRAIRKDMELGLPEVVVSNMLITNKDLKPYLTLAELHGYRVTTLVVENRHGGENLHGVTQERLEELRKKFQVKL